MISKEIAAKIKPGFRVHVTTTLGEEGTTTFEGLVIARKHGSEIGATFTVRTMLAGEGVEKIFPLHSPMITKVQILQKPKRVRRAKLYYVRNISGAEIRKKLGVSL